LDATEAADKIRSMCFTEFAITRTNEGYVFGRYIRTDERRKVRVESSTGQVSEFEVSAYVLQKVAEAPTLPELADKLESSGCK